MFIGVTVVLIVKMKLIVVMKVVRMANGIVAMVNAFQNPMYVMDQMNFVMLDGVLTVPMAQMKA
jgi:hypothetical protein